MDVVDESHSGNRTSDRVFVGRTDRERAWVPRSGACKPATLAEMILCDREEATKRIHAETIGVNEVFAQLAVLTKHQGETVENIEQSLETTRSNAAQGVCQLQRAETAQNRNRRFATAVALVGTGAAAVALLVLL